MPTALWIAHVQVTDAEVAASLPGYKPTTKGHPRQIREAAMKEKDPELREKLWDEYRKYTGSVKR